MKISTAILAAPLLATEALAFVPSSVHQPQATTTPTALQAENKQNTIMGVTAACLLGLSFSAQAAFAATDSTIQQQQIVPDIYSTAMSSSSTVVAEVEQFSLPSYDSSKGSTLIDISGDVEKVNKKTMATAKAKREYVDTSAEKLEADKLRAAEKDGSSLLDSMLGQSEADRKARIEAEKAETRANRWKTF